jgi:hypothetical protein
MRAAAAVAVALLVLAAHAPARAAPRAADLAAHAAVLEKRLKGHGLTVVVEAPFVVVGDEAPAKVRKRASGTVRWAVTLLRQDYFDRDPDDIIEVWLFKDEKSYRKGAKKYFGDEPDTPYGYYQPAHKAMIMNIGPGAGTLVHELVHPYMETNFPDVPAWFNEGVASLYEYPYEASGHIRGRVNWRLRGLKKELRSGHRRSFASLLATTTDEFYQAPDDTYAQARYLIYYLQERGLLYDYYKKFVAARKDDPTGYKTLVKVLGREDMETFHAEWVDWVLKLPDP